MEYLLKSRHICPTAPDTLRFANALKHRCFPFIREDPFVIDETPNVFIAGNQEIYEAKTMQEGRTKCELISIPRFSKTKSIVLLDLRDLTSSELSIEMKHLNTEGSMVSPMEDINKQFDNVLADVI